MRQGPYDVQVLTEDGRVLPEREVDGRTVLEAEQGLTYRVKVRVHADADGKFPAELMYARLYVDGNHAEWRGMRLKDGGAQAE
jgi:formylmethanofuran dehydrogenase subunit C